MEGADCGEVSLAPSSSSCNGPRRSPPSWKEEPLPPGAQEHLDRPRETAARESFHQDRCAAITEAVCERLLMKQPAYRECLGNVAAFILEREVADGQGSCKEAYELVALGTGDVCYGGWMEFDGRRVHDMHGLVVARRALMRYFYKQLLLRCSQDPARSNRASLPGGRRGPLRLKPRCHLHLYLSQMPHGAVKKLFAPLLRSSSSVDLNIRVQGQLRAVSYCSPTLLSSHVYCASGSDKLIRWTVLGVQGALLSHFLHPVYITSIVLADPYPNCDILNHVLSKSVQLGPEDGVPQPYRHKKVYLFEGPLAAPCGSPPECGSLSLNWCSGDERLECVDGAVGKAERDIANPGGASRPSRLCKAAMLKSFRNVAQEMKREDLVSLSTYHEAKVQATTYQRAKLQLHSHLSVRDLRGGLKSSWWTVFADRLAWAAEDLLQPTDRSKFQ
ncbi:adenosine deaminase domain-containing protein 2 [Thamnophis elegans]|uniref:adenosine deaminase domain-containing protein 2 n=1 Tax=Thamnophis elegans TaxID=35005 RepID=UPI001376F4C3|nr:adenosine deaminase domain-containing protein 2 [Thamnophis elegans]